MSLDLPLRHLSETERVTRASETRYRIGTPNSVMREMRVFGLGPRSRAVARDAVAACGGHVQVFREDGLGALLAPPGDAAASDAWLANLAGTSSVLGKWLDGVNTVIIVAAVGEPTAAVSLIAKLVQPTGALLTGLVVDEAGQPPGAVQATVSALRLHCSMLVHASDAEYVADMLTALGA